MKIERLSQDKIRIFLTFDDLSERGIQRDDLWREMTKLQDLFAEMMDQAYTELGFDATGPLAVEVFAMPAQGMVVIVTRTRLDNLNISSHDDEDMEGVYEMEVTLEESDTVLFAFRDFEHFIDAAHEVNGRFDVSGALYLYNGQYMYHLDGASIEQSRLQALVALLAEFGEATSVTTAVLEEYGACIMPEHAITLTCEYFKPRGT
ncbi:genetic competence negative regulator [Paenibacillus sp. SC116]|uniref:genetic competence negative regulator n=1 Tax=Paenibacillus sp. SC116 TaxID=2968986 RepID=UPI00215AF4A4|nr:genetic competence negative regulator [Paenibacillus sp. SC116]MCR8842995.1 genetic competence negative regulator [Paenibacillus sp. SC116]